MSHVQWWLCGLSFVMGLVLTLALTIDSAKSPAPVEKSTTAEPDEPPTTRIAATEPPTTRIAPTEQRTTKIPVTEQRTTKIPVTEQRTTKIPIAKEPPENPRRG